MVTPKSVSTNAQFYLKVVPKKYSPRRPYRCVRVRTGVYAWVTVFTLACRTLRVRIGFALVLTGVYEWLQVGTRGYRCVCMRNDIYACVPVCMRAN